MHSEQLIVHLTLHSECQASVYMRRCRKGGLGGLEPPTIFFWRPPMF